QPPPAERGKGAGLHNGPAFRRYGRQRERRPRDGKLPERSPSKEACRPAEGVVVERPARRRIDPANHFGKETNHVRIVDLIEDHTPAGPRCREKSGRFVFSSPPAFFPKSPPWRAARGPLFRWRGSKPRPGGPNHDPCL